MNLDPRHARRLALGCLAGPALLTLAWFVLGLVSPGFGVGGEFISPFSAVAHPISGLGMGETGPFMNTAFVLGGLLLAAGLAGVFAGLPGSRVPLALLCLAPLGMIMAGVFDLDHDLPHFVGFGLVAGSPLVSFPVAGRWFRAAGYRRLGNTLLVAAVVNLVFLIGYQASFDQDAVARNEGIAGLTSRALAIEVLAWFVVLGWWRVRGGARQEARSEPVGS